MQQLKKSLKNNLTKFYLQDKCFIVGNDIKTSASQDVTGGVLHSLLRTTVKQINGNSLLDVSLLKFPVSSRTFENIQDLKKVLHEEKSSLQSSSLILVKTKTILFKNRAYEMVTSCQSATKQILKLKTCAFGIISLFLILKLHSKSKN